MDCRETPANETAVQNAAEDSDNDSVHEPGTSRKDSETEAGRRTSRKSSDLDLDDGICFSALHCGSGFTFLFRWTRVLFIICRSVDLTSCFLCFLNIQFIFTLEVT